MSYEVNLLRKKGDHIGYRFILEPSFGLYDLLDLIETEESNLKNTTQRTTVESNVEKGNTRIEQGSAILASFCCQQAIRESRKIGEQAKIDELSQKIRSINDKVLAEMKVTETIIELHNILFTVTDGSS